MKKIKVSIKAAALTLATVMLVGGVAGGTLAWLTDKTESVTNVFTSSNIGVELDETEEDFKMIPGWTIEKDPKASVTATSEDCYLFVKVEEHNGVSIDNGDEVTFDFDSLIKYEIADGWETLQAGDPVSVYYRVFDSNDSKNENEKGTQYSILGSGTYKFTNDTSTEEDDIDFSWTEDEVFVYPEVTKETMDALSAEGATKPTLTFKAYAVQLYSKNKEKFTPQQAWALVE